MLKKIKNCTFTQTQLDMNGGVGISLGIMAAKLCPELLLFNWYIYLLIAIIFSIPIWIVIKKQFSNNESLEQKPLSNYNVRLWN
tara:strand:- start:1484 stop:1735 length:252 start_codon:yes stop_codon:yes gene_type:complete